MFNVVWNGKVIKQFKTKEKAEVFMDSILLDDYDIIGIEVI